MGPEDLIHAGSVQFGPVGISLISGGAQGVLTRFSQISRQGW